MKGTKVVYESQNSDSKGTQQVEIDGKVYTADVIKTMVSESAAATQKSQQAQKVIDAATAYGITADEFLQHAEGAIAVISNLQTKGLINEKGEIVLPNRELNDPNDLKNKGKGTNDDPFAGILNKKGAKPDDKTNSESVVILGAIQKLIEKVGALEVSVGDTRDTQTLMLRTDREEKIKAVYPDLEEQDISKVFAKTLELRKEGKKASLLEVAKLVNDERQQYKTNIEKKFAEEHGFNYEEISKQKKGASQTTVEDLLTAEGVSGITKGRKLSLFPRDKAKEVSPLDAVNAFLKKLP